MNQIRSTAPISVTLTILAFAVFAISAFLFDPEAYVNDWTVVGLFIATGLFWLAGLYRPQGRIVASDLMALAAIGIGLFMFLLVAFGSVNSAFFGCSLGGFMICSAIIYAKAGIFTA